MPSRPAYGGLPPTPGLLARISDAPARSRGPFRARRRRASRPGCLVVGLPSASRYMSRVADWGAFSRKSMNVASPSAMRTSMKPPPPMLPADGCVTASANPTATAASTAFPPAFSTATPTSVAWLLGDHHRDARGRVPRCKLGMSRVQHRNRSERIRSDFRTFDVRFCDYFFRRFV